MGAKKSFGLATREFIAAQGFKLADFAEHGFDVLALLFQRRARYDD